MKVTVQHINEDVVKDISSIESEITQLRYEERRMSNEISEVRRLFSCLVELITNAQKDTTKKKK